MKRPKYTIMHYPAMTVLLEYTDRSLQFFTNLMLNIPINIYFTLPSYAGIMLNAFNDLLCLNYAA